MKIFAQKQNQTPPQTSSSLSRSKPNFATSPAASNSSATTRFAHEFSRIRVHSSNHIAFDELPVITAGKDSEEPASIATADSDVTKADAELATSPRLTKVTVGPPIGAECGIFKWAIKWELDKKTTKGGLVVQKIEAKYDDLKGCKGTPYVVPKGIFDPNWYPFWEAWEIKKNQKVTNQGTGDDLYESPLGITRSTGTYSITGSAQFYEGATLSNTQFKVLKKPPSGILPMTKIDPKLPGGTGSLPHNLKAAWDCCAKGQEEKGATLLKTE